MKISVTATLEIQKYNAINGQNDQCRAMDILRRDPGPICVKYIAGSKDEQCPRNVRNHRFGAAVNQVASTISSLLRPEGPKGERFETLADARAESERSEQLLTIILAAATGMLAEFLQECRAGDYECNQPFCPICAGRFRRWFIAELLRVTKGHDPVYIYTVLLKEAPHDKINDLDPAPYRHQLRKRLERAGLGQAPVIGGFEIVYKARRRVWVLHVNLVVIGGKKSAHKKLKNRSFKNRDIERPIMGAKLNEPGRATVIHFEI